MVASVAINGAILAFAINAPFTAPSSAPIKQAQPIANTGSSPLTIMPAIKALDNAKIAPTDKSIPPVKITNVIPKAIKALIETWRNKFSKFIGAKKSGFNTPTITNNPIRPINGITFCPICLINIIILHPWLMP